MTTTPDSTPGPDSGPSYIHPGAQPTGTPHGGGQPYGGGSGTQPGQTGQPGAQSGFFDAIRRLGIVRTEDRWIGGVGGGLALRFGLDPLLVRGLLIVFGLLGGIGLIFYGAAWALLPERDGRIHLQEAGRGAFDVALLGAGALALVGLVSPGIGFGLGWGIGGFGWLGGLGWLVLVVAVVVIVASAANRGGRAPWAPGAPSATYTSPPTAYPAAAGPTTTADGGPAYASSPAAGAHASGSHVPGSQAPDTHVPGSAAASGPPHGAGPSWSATPTPTPPAGPVVRGPGAAAFGVLAGLGLLIGAGFLVADRAGVLGGSWALLAVGSWIVLLGLAIVVAGARGRSSGSLGFLGVVALVLALPVTAALNGDADWRAWWGDGRFTVVGSTPWVPADADEARSGLRVGAGDTDIDLTDFTLGTDPVEVPVSVGAGDVDLLLPDGVPAEVTVRMAAGQLTSGVGNGFEVSGLAIYEVIRSPEVREGAEPLLVVRLQTLAGNVDVETAG